MKKSEKRKEAHIFLTHIRFVNKVRGDMRKMERKGKMVSSSQLTADALSR